MWSFGARLKLAPKGEIPGTNFSSLVSQLEKVVYRYLSLIQMYYFLADCPSEVI